MEKEFTVDTELYKKLYNHLVSEDFKSSKYYVPTKEELCWGFECDIYSVLTVSGCVQVSNWEHITWNPNYGYREDDYRVRFLCAEDIILNGFTPANNNLDYVRWVNTEHLEDGEWSEYYQRIRIRPNWFNDGHAVVSIYKVPVHTQEQFDEIDWNTYDRQSTQFCGKIKNASEFNKILDRLV